MANGMQNTYFDCTGWMVGESAVVTAGHCVYNHGGTNTFAYNVTVTPGYNTDAPNSTPLGSCRIFGESVLSPWYDNGDMGYDYGIYELACKVGQMAGNLGFKTVSGDGIGTPIAVTGYPSDKGGTTMWSSIGSISSSTPLLFYYDNDMKPGQSGGPAWDYLDQNCHLCVIAVNANEFDPPTLNNGSRVNSTAFNYFLSGRGFTVEQIFLPFISKE